MADDAVAESDQVIDLYRKLVQKYIKLHIYDAAQFWAEKVVVLTEGNPADVYCLAQTMVFLQQYHRAIHLLQSTELHKAYYLCSYVTAHCLFAIKDYQKALNLLESIDLDALSQNESNTAEAGMIDNTPKHEILASIFLLKGKVWELMENYAAATTCFVQALTSDVHCFEAYGLIIQHNLLNSVEEEDMIQSLPILQQCSRKDAQVLLTLYLNMSKSSSTRTTGWVIDDQKPSYCGAVPTTCNTELSTESKPSTPVTAGPSTSQSEPLTPAVVASTTSRSEPAVTTTPKDAKKRSPYSEGKEGPEENAVVASTTSRSEPAVTTTPKDDKKRSPYSEGKEGPEEKAVVASTTSRSEPAVTTTPKDDKKRSPYSEGKEGPDEKAVVASTSSRSEPAVTTTPKDDKKRSPYSEGKEGPEEKAVAASTSSRSEPAVTTTPKDAKKRSPYSEGKEGPEEKAVVASTTSRSEPAVTTTPKDDKKRSPYSEGKEGPDEKAVVASTSSRSEPAVTTTPKDDKKRSPYSEGKEGPEEKAVAASTSSRSEPAVTTTPKDAKKRSPYSEGKEGPEEKAVVASTSSRSEPAVTTTPKDDKKRSPYSEGKEEPEEKATTKVEQPNQEKEPEKLLETPEKKQFDDVTPSREELEDAVFLSKLEESYDVVVAKAQRHYDAYDYTKCIKLTERVLKEDPYHHSCLILHIGCQMELKLHTKLFALAHNLLTVYPNMPIAWYAIGCYYMLIGNGDCSQKHLEKSILLSKSFGPAWIALGHVYATMKNDHEQAIFTYTSALRYMRGSHLPFMYMAIECSQTDSALADSYFTKARQAKPNDPGLLQEIGVHEFRCGKFKPARRYFKLALKHIQLVEGPVFSAQWAPVLNNLGHTYRKLGKYAKALDYHHRALALTPESPKIYCAIGFVHSLIGNISEAIEWFHKALSLQRDAFSTTMLDHLVQYTDEGPVFYEHDAPPQHLATIMEESSDTSSTTTNENSDMTVGCSQADYEVRPSTSGIQSPSSTLQDDSFTEDSFGYDSDMLHIVLQTPPDIWTYDSPIVTPSSDGSMGLAQSVATPRLEISTDRSSLEHSRSSVEPSSRPQSSGSGIASSSMSTIDLSALNLDDPVDDPLDDPTDK